MNLNRPNRNTILGILSVGLALSVVWVPCIWWVGGGTGGVGSARTLLGAPIATLAAVLVGSLLCWFCISRNRWSMWAGLTVAAIAMGVVLLMVLYNLRSSMHGGYLWTIYVPLAALAAVQAWSACSKLRSKLNGAPTTGCTATI